MKWKKTHIPAQIWFFAAVAALLAAVWLVSRILPLVPGSYAQVIRLNWDLRLPEQYTERYSADSGPSFHGDGTRYHVFLYDPPDLLTGLVPWRECGETAPMAELMDSLDIPAQERPDFTLPCLTWEAEQRDGSKLYLVYVQGRGLLHVLESFR